jgi:hypothetical protein
MPAAAVSGLAGGLLVVNLQNATAQGDAPRGFSMSANFGMTGGSAVYGARAYVDVSGSEEDQDTFNWLTNGAGANYQVHATLNSGTLSTGTTGSWLAMSSTRSWETTGSANLTIKIRDAHTLTELDSCTVSLLPA